MRGCVEKKWEIKKKIYDDVIKQLLYNRGVIGPKVSDEDVDKFINPKYEDLGDATEIIGVKTATTRIEKAKKAGEIIGIYADYDADGIPGAAFLSKVLEKLGIKYHTYIPSRAEGYGMSQDGIDYLIKKGVSLIITVDLGIKNFKEAEYCWGKKIDLIITDHHLPDEKVPMALAVINPKRKNSKYLFRDLSGAGVVYKLAEALGKKYPKEINEKFLKWNLDLIAISTISDVVPLIGENRIISKFGILVLQKTRNLGLEKLIKIAKIEKRNIGAYHVGFLLGPRINAPGRIDHATKSYQLLTSKDAKESKEIAQFLETKNYDRQEMMKKVEEEAANKIIRNKLNKNKVISVFGNWPKGVLGPSASNLVQRFNRPIILLAKDEESLTGSARSIEGVNILEIINGCSKYLKKFGGHKGAAGLSLDMKTYDKFIRCLSKVADDKIDDKDLIKKIKVDMELKFNVINHYLFKDLEKLEPYGMGNSRPIFVTFGATIDEFRYVGKEKDHLSMKIKKDGRLYKSIYFNYKDDKSKIFQDSKIDLVYTIEEDVWNGKRNISLKIIDIK